MHCRIKRILKSENPDVYALYRDACVGDKLFSPCTLIIPDDSTLTALRAKLGKSYDDARLLEVSTALKSLILTQPHATLDGPLRNVIGQDVLAADNTINGVKIARLHEVSDGERKLFYVYKAAGPLEISGERRRREDRPREEKPFVGGGRRPRRRQGGDVILGMIGKHHAMVQTGVGCSPFAEALCYQLAALLSDPSKADNGLLAAVRLVASYDPAVFFTSLGIGTDSPVIPASSLTIQKGASGSSYSAVLDQFLEKGDQALIACFRSKSCDLDKVTSTIAARREALAASGAIEAAYTALGTFYSECGIRLSGEQKMRADKVAYNARMAEGIDGYIAAISAPAVGAPAAEGYFHLVSRVLDANCKDEQQYKRYYSASSCSSAEQDEVIAYIKSLQ